MSQPIKVIKLAVGQDMRSGVWHGELFLPSYKDDSIGETLRSPAYASEAEAIVECEKIRKMVEDEFRAAGFIVGSSRKQ